MTRLVKFADILVIPFLFLAIEAAVYAMLHNAWPSALFLPVVLLAGFSAYRHTNRRQLSALKALTVRHSNAVWATAQLLSLVVMLLFVLKLKVGYSWDWGMLLSSAAEYVREGSISYSEYYARYPNNQIWEVFLIGYFRVILLLHPGASDAFLQNASIVLSLCFTQLTLFLLRQCGRKIYRDEWKALLVGFCGLAAIPFYYYAQFAYTDTISMLLLTLILELSLSMRDAQKNTTLVLKLIASSVLAALVFRIKILAFIGVIALAIEAVLRCRNFRRLLVLSLAGLCIFGVSQWFLKTVSQSVLSITDEMYEEYEYPAVHWIMMGMNDYGGWSEDDVNFTYYAGDYAEKQAADLAELKQRAADYGVSGTLHHLLFTKMVRTWGNSTLAGDDYTHRSAYHSKSISQRLFGSGEPLHWIVLLYTWSFHILLLAGLLLEAVLSFQQPAAAQRCMPERFAVYGVGLFLTFWECNSRYLLPFLPFMLLAAFEGWYLLRSRRLQRSSAPAASARAAIENENEV